MSSVTNASRISPPAAVGLPVLGPNPNAAAAAREKGPSGMMVKELMLTDIAPGSDIPWRAPCGVSTLITARSAQALAADVIADR